MAQEWGGRNDHVFEVNRIFGRGARRRGLGDHGDGGAETECRKRGREKVHDGRAGHSVASA